MITLFLIPSFKNSLIGKIALHMVKRYTAQIKGLIV